MSSINATALQALRQADLDGTGTLSLSELKKSTALLPATVRQSIQKNGAQSVLDSMDANADGSLSLYEFSAGISSLTDSSAASVLLKAQESQSPLSQMLVGLKSSAYSSLVSINADATSTAMQGVLAAYAAGGKV